MPSRTQIICLHEGKKGRSMDPVFIRALLKALKPGWIRPCEGNKIFRPVACGGRNGLIARTPTEIRSCQAMGADTTLMVWADLDHDMADGEALKQRFWAAAQESKELRITKEEFEQVVFVFAKDRLENWIEYLQTGFTDEAKEGPRLKHDRAAADAAKMLAERCAKRSLGSKPPPSLVWSCENWRALVARMQP